MHRLLFLVPVLFCSMPAWAQDTFGTYGYRHHELHAHEVIKNLMAKTGSSCCDGGMGGECRATEIMQTGDGLFYNRGGTWCPIPPYVAIQTNIGLPADIQAIICVDDEHLAPGVCPQTVYCAGAQFSG